MKRQKIGKIGENIAANYLAKQGYNIITRNYRCKAGEIDIIAEDRKYLTFVEVKTRTNTNYGLPQESVTKKKQMRIRKIALNYLQEKNQPFRELRFDVVSILIAGNGTAEIELIKDAF